MWTLAHLVLCHTLSLSGVVAPCTLLSGVACCAVLQVGGAIETAKPEAPVDVMMGIGGTPEVSSTHQHSATNMVVLQAVPLCDV